MAHIHAELMAQYAEDAKQHDEPWELWQHGDDETWTSCTTHPGWFSDHSYRRKPRTIQIGDYEVPETLQGFAEIQRGILRTERGFSRRTPLRLDAQLPRLVRPGVKPCPPGSPVCSTTG